MIGQLTVRSIAVSLMVCIFLILILSDIKVFSMWSQVIDYDSNISFRDSPLLLQISHPHFLRYMLVAHIFEIHRMFGVEVNFIFGLEMLVFIYLIYRLIDSVLKHSNKVRISHTGLLLFLLILSLMMNGRIIYALSGGALLIYTYYFNMINQYGALKLLLLLFTALLLLAVSTGTFVAGLISIFLYLLFIIKDAQKISAKIKYIFVVTVLAIVASVPAQIYVNKNLSYYDYDVMSMLDHGPGRIFNNDLVLASGILFIPVILLVILIIYKVIKKNAILLAAYSLLVPGVVVGLFGHSTLAIIIPAVLLLAYNLFIRKQM
jgi:hypothetical protein